MGNQAFRSIGLEKSLLSVKGACLDFQKGQPCLEHLFEVETAASPPSEISPLYLKELNKTLQEMGSRYLITTALSQEEVLTRSLFVKLKKEKDIDAVLAFQAEPILPYPTDQALLDKILIEKVPEGTSLTLLAAKKEHLQRHLQEWQEIGVEPEAVTSQAAALAAFSRWAVKDETLFFVVHLEDQQIFCSLVQEGKLLGSQISATHLDLLKQSCENPGERADPVDFASFDFSSIDRTKQPLLYQAFQQIQMELMRTLLALGKHVRGQEVTAVLCTGEGGAYPLLIKALFTPLNKTILVPENHLGGISISPLDFITYAIPIGAALSVLRTSPFSIDFRQGEFAFPNPWRRYRIPFFTYFAACLFVAFALYLYGEATLQSEANEIRNEYISVLASMKKPASYIEELVAKKTSKETAPQANQAVPIEKLSMDELSLRVGLLEKELQSSPDLFPLLPNIPRVSDLLAWLSTHPNAAQKDEKSGFFEPLIQIDTLTYTLIKRPESSKKTEKYQVRVEIEFTSPSPKIAREFHDALISPNQLVDPKGEVKWTTNRGKYRTSFVLKDKTVYPSSGG